MSENADQNNERSEIYHWGDSWRSLGIQGGGDMQYLPAEDLIFLYECFGGPQQPPYTEVIVPHGQQGQLDSSLSPPFDIPDDRDTLTTPLVGLHTSAPTVLQPTWTFQASFANAYDHIYEPTMSAFFQNRTTAVSFWHTPPAHGPPFNPTLLDDNPQCSNVNANVGPTSEPMLSQMGPSRDSPGYICGCCNWSLHDFLAPPYTPYKQGPNAKPSRARGSLCIKEFIERFPHSHRETVVHVLQDPHHRHERLKELVRRHEGGDQRNKFGCWCCVGARFQSSQKVVRHLRGLLDIRPYPCSYGCGRRAIDPDDLKKHEKTCRLNPSSSRASSSSSIFRR